MTNSRQNPTHSVIIRLASREDGELLEHLAALDSARRPVGTVLIAETDGHPVAALALTDDQAIADPFLPTADVMEPLRLRAREAQPADERRLFRWAAASRK